DWFFNRVQKGFVCVRNPYDPLSITQYRLDPSIVDGIIFTTKNPEPMISRLSSIASLNPYFFVTITPYENDIEPNVPYYCTVAHSVIKLASIIGSSSLCWRYDPILITTKYSIAHHIKVFAELCKVLEHSVSSCVISFVQLYEKTKRNFPSLREVSLEEQKELLEALVFIARRYGIKIRTCAVTEDFTIEGLEKNGCITRSVFASYTGIQVPPMCGGAKRKTCLCDLPTRDIGEYNSCLHGCLYCYANYDKTLVNRNYAKHDPSSPILIGSIEGCEVKNSKQEGYKAQLSLF
ncbi:MAG TPA: DUF1848 domain-containing protein, partial [Treponemataceae bacterium]|nr:DUF1848 domain-containing protein [Treponemataceae bacterium]